MQETTSGAPALAEEWALLQEVMERLNAATTMEETLRAFLVPAPEGAEASLSTIDADESGAPSWLTVIAALNADGRAGSTIGARYFLPEIPFASFYLSSPGVPVMVESIPDDPRIDDFAKQLFAESGMVATILMTLTLRGRIVGMLALRWEHTIRLTEREQRIYQALSRHAALLLDNLVMVERLQASLSETREQGLLLATVLDHVPVGIVCIDARTRAPLITNQAARTLAGGEVVMGPGRRTILYPGSDLEIPDLEQPATRAAVTGEIQRRELDFRTADGARKSVEVVGVPTRGASGKVERVVVVLSDLTGRKQAEEERARLQEEVIRVQAAALAERSTPLIPITDDVLVMPLIGTIDPGRGQGILEAVLHGTRERAAKVTIIDITGVPSLDTRAAAALIQAAQALRLLGVEPVLSGIGPNVAQALVGLDVSLSGVVTCGTLQSGIEYALRRLGKKF